jgi:hypothetical protein
MCIYVHTWCVTLYLHEIVLELLLILDCVNLVENLDCFLEYVKLILFRKNKKNRNWWWIYSITCLIYDFILDDMHWIITVKCDLFFYYPWVIGNNYVIFLRIELIHVWCTCFNYFIIPWLVIVLGWLSSCMICLYKCEFGKTSWNGYRGICNFSCFDVILNS